MKHKHYRRNTEEYVQELQQLDQDSLSPAHKILGLSKSEDEEQPEQPKKQKKEIDKVKDALVNLKEDKPNVKGMFSRIYSIPSNARSKISRMTGQVPRSANVYGSHYPVARILDDNNTLVLHTSDYGTDGKTKELIEKIKNEVPSIFPDFKVLELHHPDYRHSAKAMRIKSEKNLADYFKAASENHPDENYRKHALDAHLHLTKIKKAEYGKPIHQKRIEHEGWDGKQNEQKRVGRIAEYLQKVGLTPDLHSDEGRMMGATLPSSVSINPEGDPHDQQLIHEAAHAMLTPVGMGLPEYQDFIGKPGLEGKLKATAYRKEMQEMHGGGLPEQTAQHLEAGIARRSGVEPFRSPKRGLNPKSAEEKARRHAHKTLGLLDEGIHTFDPFTGEKQVGDSVNALINARARKDQSLIKPVQEKVHSRLKQQKDLTAEDFLAASEKDYSGIGSSLKKAAIDLVKGSLQRKYPFNPNKDVEYEDASKIAHWQEGDGDREAVPSIQQIDPNARFRALNKLHSRTEVRRHPKTGERMFLLHRGVGNSEHVPSSTQKSSWTPHLEIAETFTVDDMGKVFSAWIPESKIHNIPTQLGSLSSGDSDGGNYFADEHEVIVEPHNFLYAKRQKRPTKDALNAKINEDFSGRYKKKQPKTQEQKQKSIAENPLHPSKFDDKLAANEKQKPDLKKTLTAGMPAGAPSTLTGGEALQKESLSADLQKPFSSKAQRRFAYANPEKFGGKKGIKEWENKTPKNIPEKKKKKNTKKSIKKNYTESGIKPDLQKMSRGLPEFKNFPKVTSRPDQEIQNIDTKRQARMFGQKAAVNSVYREGNPYREMVGDKIRQSANPFDEKEINANLAASKQRFDYDMPKEQFTHRGLVAQGSMVKKPIGMVAGEGNYPTGSRRQHEAIHLLLDDLSKKYGNDIGNYAQNKINELIHPDLKDHLGVHMSKVGYNPKIHHMEYAPHLYEMLHDPKTRDMMRKTNPNFAAREKELMGHAKKSWKAILEFAKHLKGIE